MNQNELFHYGIKRRSGRYPWGSGERPYQDREAKRKEKNLAIGKERLENRIREANSRTDADILASKVGWQYTRQSTTANKAVKEIKDFARELLADEERLEEFGDRTRKKRNVATGITIGGSSGLLAIGLGAMIATNAPLFLPISAVGAAVIANTGYKYLKESKY